jgi:hypothetical protein
MLFVLLADGGYGRTAQSQPRTEERVHRQEANHQREGKPQGSREELAHARTLVRGKEFVLQPATERTVKVHQSDDKKFVFLRHSFAAIPGSIMQKFREFSFT